MRQLRKHKLSRGTGAGPAILPRVAANALACWIAVCGAGLGSTALGAAPEVVRTDFPFRPEVEAGCKSPVFPAQRHAFYVDPTSGSSAGDGSRSHPWRTLDVVLATKMSRIHANDIIYLASGNHGAVTATTNNDGFVEIAAAPGQAPVLDSLEITGSNWVFSNLKIQSVRGVAKAGYGNALVEVRAGVNPASNIIIRGADISPSADAPAWTPADWSTKGLAGVNVEGGSERNFCVSLTHSTIRYTGGSPKAGAGVSVQFHADHSLLADNLIDHFADDAVDYGANDLTLRNNVITNNVGLDDGNHNDAFQGYVPGGKLYKDIHEYRNIIIHGNIVIRQTDPNLHQPIGLQGIDNFGSVATDWYNVSVTDNVVITNAYHGITFGAVHHALIANNTVLADGHATSEVYAGTSGRLNLPGDLVWIMVEDQLNRLVTPGGASNDVVVSGNIAQALEIRSQGAQVRDNIALKTLTLVDGGTVARYKVAGRYGDGNLLEPSLLHDFTDFHPGEFRFGVALKAGSRATGKGAPPARWPMER